MTVSELIDYLKQFDGNQKVVIAQPSSDYWGTVCASEITEAKEGVVEYSDYHRKYKISDQEIDEDDENEEEYDQDLKKVIILQ
jgi:hypothetical protein